MAARETEGENPVTKQYKKRDKRITMDFITRDLPLLLPSISK